MQPSKRELRAVVPAFDGVVRRFVPDRPARHAQIWTTRGGGKTGVPVSVAVLLCKYSATGIASGRTAALHAAAPWSAGPGACPGCRKTLRALVARAPRQRTPSALVLWRNIVAKEAMWVADVVGQFARAKVYDVVRTGGSVQPRKPAHAKRNGVSAQAVSPLTPSPPITCPRM